MKTKQFLILALLSASFVIISCKSNPTDSSATNGSELSEASESASSTSTQKSRYAIKSGIVEYKTQIMGMDAKQTL